MPKIKLMKTIVIFYSDKNSSYADEKAFDGKSSRDLSLAWAKELDLPFFTVKSATMKELFFDIHAICQNEKAENVVFSYDDLPFLNVPLTKTLIASHEEYKSEYSYADGYPYGLSPEVLNAGTVGILAGLCDSTFAEEGGRAVIRTGIFDFIKKDINSFEVNSVIANDDWRLFRFSFDCGKKENFIACTRLFEALKKEPCESADKISEIAAGIPGILKTVPGFYEIQIAKKVGSEELYSPYSKFWKEKFGENVIFGAGEGAGTGAEKKSAAKDDFMPFEKVAELVEKIASFSENAVISLSAWGEPLYHPDFVKIVEKILSYKGLSVFFETDGLFVTDELCAALKNAVEKAEERTNGWQKVMVAVKLDSVTEETYKKIHKIGGGENAIPNPTPNACLNTAAASVAKLYASLGPCVYPQFVRMEENEAELEQFFRFWNEKSNPSGGNLIIQKYNSYCGVLPDKKTADLSPIDRNVCWHLRRDMTILLNGDVPLCRCQGLNPVGNAFTEPLEQIWQKFDNEIENQLKNTYCEKCRNCDEYYTFNF